jgi:hypothetical protein
MSLTKTLLTMGLAASGLAVGAAHASDTVLHIPLADVLDMPEARQRLDGSVKFYLAGSATPDIEKRFREDVARPKTSGVGKADEFGCKWAALTALIKFQGNARLEGANAMVDLVSFNKEREYRSETDVECLVGTVVTRVALKGRYAKVADGGGTASTNILQKGNP